MANPRTNKMAEPLVSIVIPTFNRASLIGETITSISSQTYRNWECIVIDDGSKDETASVVATFLSDKRIRFVNRLCKQSGASACRNIGMSLAQGDYIIFLDSDDLLSPNCLQRRIQVMNEHPEADSAVFPTRIFENTPGDLDVYWNAFTEQDALERFFCGDTPWQTTGPIWRRRSLSRVGGWDERALSWQDWEFHVRALAAGLTCVQVAEPDSYWRDSGRGSISDASKQRRYKANQRRVLSNVLLGVSKALRERDQLMTRKRRMLAGQLYRFAISHTFSRKKALTIWRRARSSGAVNFFEFSAVSIYFHLSRRVPERILYWLFPEMVLFRRRQRTKSFVG